MDKYYELMSYDDLDYYYVFSDAKTNELLFLNQAICNFLHLKLDNCIGKKCHKILYDRDDICPNCVNEELINSKFTSMESVIPLKNLNINCNISLVNINDKLIRITKLPINPKNINQVSSVNDNDILNDLTKNLKNGNFKIHLQPKFKIIEKNNHFTTELVGAEALVRRYDPNLNEIISPNEFISLYENMSVIRHIDLYVLENVCNVLSKINETPKFANNSFIISVNFSCATLLEFDCVNNIRSICDKFNVPYNCIMIEIAKDIFIENHFNFIKRTLKNLSKLGFSLALSNVNILNPNFFVNGDDAIFLFKEIKISKNLIIDNHTLFNEYSKNLFESVIQTHSKNSDFVSVGIETKEQMNFFHSINCTLQQGYIHCMPLTIDNFMQQFIH